MRLDFIKWELIGLCKLAVMCQNGVEWLKGRIYLHFAKESHFEELQNYFDKRL